MLAPHPLFWGKQFFLIAEARQVPEPMAMINSGRMEWVSRGPGCQVLHVRKSLWKSRHLTKLHWALTTINLLQSLVQAREQVSSTRALPWPSSRPQQGGGDTLPPPPAQNHFISPESPPWPLLVTGRLVLVTSSCSTQTTGRTLQFWDGGGGASGIHPTTSSPLGDPQHQENALQALFIHPRQKTSRLQTGQRGCKGVGACEDTSSARGSLPAHPSLAPAPGLGQQHRGTRPASTGHCFPPWDPDEHCCFWGDS